MIAGDLPCLLLSNESGCPKTDGPKMTQTHHQGTGFVAIMFQIFGCNMLQHFTGSITSLVAVKQPRGNSPVEVHFAVGHPVVADSRPRAPAVPDDTKQ